MSSVRDWDALVAEVDASPSTHNFGPHYLVVDEVWPEEGEAEWHLEHTLECNLRSERLGYTVGSPAGLKGFWREASDCPYTFELDNCGTDTFDKQPHELLEGRYPVAWWHRTYTHWEYGPEYDSGIAVGEKQPESTTAVEGEK